MSIKNLLEKKTFNMDDLRNWGKKGDMSLEESLTNLHRLNDSELGVIIEICSAWAEKIIGEDEKSPIRVEGKIDKDLMIAANAINLTKSKQRQRKTQSLRKKTEPVPEVRRF